MRYSTVEYSPAASPHIKYIASEYMTSWNDHSRANKPKINKTKQQADTEPVSRSQETQKSQYK